MGILDLNTQEILINKEFLLDKGYRPDFFRSNFFDERNGDSMTGIYSKSIDICAKKKTPQTAHTVVGGDYTHVITSFKFRYNLPCRMLHVIVPKYVYWTDYTRVFEVPSASMHAAAYTRGSRATWRHPDSLAKKFYEDLRNNMDGWIAEDVIMFGNVQYENDLNLFEDVIINKAHSYDLIMEKPF